MKNTLLAVFAAALLGCGSVVTDETGDSSSGSGDTASSSSAVTGSSSSTSSSSSASSGVTTSASSSSVGSGGASASSSSSAVTVGGGSSVSSTAGSGGSMQQLLPLNFQMNNPPDPTVITSESKGFWPFGSYTITNPNPEDLTIDTVKLTEFSPSGGMEDFQSVGISGGGTLYGTGVPTQGSPAVIVTLQTPIVVPANSSSTVIDVIAITSFLVSSSACPQPHACARSGDQPDLLVDDVTVKEGPVGVTIENVPFSCVLRTSKPIVVQQALSSTTLANIDQDLIKFWVGADAGKSIELKKIGFDVTQTPNAQFTSFHIRRGATDLAPGEYDMRLEFADMSYSQITKVYVNFPSGESISGSGNVYTLHATVSGAVAGESVTLSLIKASLDQPFTGGISWDDTGAILAPGGTTPSSSFGSFLWSDLSALPHSQTSYDWTNDVWAHIPDMTSTLSL